MQKYTRRPTSSIATFSWKVWKFKCTSKCICAPGFNFSRFEKVFTLKYGQYYMVHIIRARYGLHEWCINYAKHNIWTILHGPNNLKLRLRYPLEIRPTVLTNDENVFIFCKTRVSKEYSAVFFYRSNFILSCNSIKFSNKTFYNDIYLYPTEIRI